MNKVLIGSLLAGGVMAFLVLGAILGTFFGAIGGWIVSLFFGETLTAFFAVTPFAGLQIWQIGAGMGFVGGFFKSIQTQTTKN